MSSDPIRLRLSSSTACRLASSRESRPCSSFASRPSTTFSSCRRRSRSWHARAMGRYAEDFWFSIGFQYIFISLKVFYGVFTRCSIRFRMF